MLISWFFHTSMLLFGFLAPDVAQTKVIGGSRNVRQTGVVKRPGLLDVGSGRALLCTNEVLIH